MFINSIFLPKNLSDQTMPEGISGKSGNFSHLFSNVFRIVKDEQNGAVPFQLTELDSENATETQSQLLNVSLLSDNKATLDNQNISSIIAAFLSKLNPEEAKKLPVNDDKSLENNNIPKYFSLNKNDFISQIKNIVETLKKGDVKNLENVSISLIANGQSIQINPLTTDVVKLENWVSMQLETNNDFEILVKNSAQKLAVDVEPVRTETIKSTNRIEVIAENSNVDIDGNNISAETNNKVIAASTLEHKPETEGEYQSQLKGLKTTTADSIIKDKTLETSTSQKTILKNTGEVKFIPNEIRNLFSKVAGLKKLPEINESQKVQSTNNKIVDDNVKSDVIKTNDSTIKDVNFTELTKSENKISVKSNQKLSSVSISKNDIKEKIVLNELLDKTSVKGIEVKIENTVKTVSSSTPQNKSDNQTETTTLRAETIKVQSPILNEVTEKNLSTPSEIKQQSVKNNFKTDTLKSENTAAAKTENQIKLSDATKVNITPETGIKQKLFVDVDLVENENALLPKSEQVKVVNNNQQSLKENIKEAVLEPNRKNVIPEIKTEFKKVDSKLTTEIVEDSSKNLFDNKAVKEVAKESVKEIIPLKSKSTEINKLFVEVDSDNTPEKLTNTTKEKNVFENLKTSVKEFANKEVKTENTNKTQFENKNTKVDFIQRRVYSQIPPIEIFTDEVEAKNIKNTILSAESNKTENIKPLDETVKSTPNQPELKNKNEKQVWVKVSLEKNDKELLSDSKKSTPQQNKITIDVNNDGMKKDFEGNNFTEKDLQVFSKTKPQTVNAESSQTTEVKNNNHTQNTTSQQDLSANLKPEIKIEQTTLKSTLHTDETKFTSRAAEMIEKVKVISSGEMIREIHKVFESGEKQSIVLRLVPKELGAVKIMLDTIDNVLNAKVEVENETVGNIVRNNIDQLKQNLLQSGVNVGSINISYHNSEQKQPGFNNHKRKNSGYQQNIETEDIDETILTKKMGYNTYEYLA